MTDFYTNLCFAISTTDEEADWLWRFFDRMLAFDQYAGVEISIATPVYTGSKEMGILFRDDGGSADIETLSCILYRFCKRFNRTVSFEWSNTASRSVTDSNGGGAVYINPDMDPPNRMVSTNELLTMMEKDKLPVSIYGY